MKSVSDIINTLQLQPHPEGGYFKETYRSEGFVLSSSLSTDYIGDRNYSTCIYFLLTSDSFSAFHRIKQDEIWHFYDGAPILLHVISPEGNYSKHQIGRDFSNNEMPQLVVPGGHWFAAEVIEPNSYSLVGCTVSPGFDFKDFEMLSREDLVGLFPQHIDIINKLTHR